MVVVDNAKKMISKTIDISVTSVLQTTAGKMIFGKYDERVHTPPQSGNGTIVRCARAIPSPCRGRRRENHDRIVDSDESSRHTARGGPGYPHGSGPPRKKPAPAASNSCCWKARPILLHTVRKFVASARVGEIVIAVRAEDTRMGPGDARGGVRKRPRARGGRRRLPPGIGGERAAFAGAGVRTGGSARRGAAVHRSGDDSIRSSTRRPKPAPPLSASSRRRHRQAGHPRHQHVKIRDTLPREKLVLAQTPAGLPLRSAAAARSTRRARTASSAPTRASLVERLERGSQRGAGQRPQHQNHQAHRHGSGPPVPARGIAEPRS